MGEIALLKQESPPWPKPGGPEGSATGLLGKAVNALPVLALRGFDREPHLLPQGPTDEPAHTVGLPAGRLHDLFQGGAVGPSQQIQDLGRLAPLPSGSGLLFAFGNLCGLRRFGRRLRRGGPFPDFPLAGATRGF